MRITEKILIAGLFWLPSNPQDQIRGKLSIADGGKIELQLFGMFGSGIFKFNEDIDISRILGFDSNLPATAVTLDRCHYIRKPTFPNQNEIYNSRIFVGGALLGAHYEPNHTPTFNTFRFTIEGIEEWLGNHPVNINLKNWPEEMSLKYHKPVDIVISSFDGTELQLTVEGAVSWNSVIETKITYHAYIKLVSKTERPLTYFIDIATRLNAFFCFATNKTVSIKDVIVTSENMLIERGGGHDPMHVPVKIFYQNRFFSSDQPKVYAGDMLFRYVDIKDTSTDTIQKWMKMSETVMLVLNLYFHKMDTYQYMEDKLLILTLGLEIYHRRIFGKNQRKEITLRDRLCALLTAFPNFYADVDRLSQDIVDVRNYFTHYDNKHRNKSQNMGFQHFLCMKMESVFQLHCLKHVGFDDEKILQVVEGNRLLKQKIEMENPL